MLSMVSYKIMLQSLNQQLYQTTFILHFLHNAIDSRRHSMDVSEAAHHDCSIRSCLREMRKRRKEAAEVFPGTSWDNGDPGDCFPKLVKVNDSMNQYS